MTHGVTLAEASPEGLRIGNEPSFHRLNHEVKLLVRTGYTGIPHTERTNRITNVPCGIGYRAL